MSGSKRHAGAACAIVVLLLAVCLTGCREKEGDDSGAGLGPPLGLAFSVPSGDVSFFALAPLRMAGSGRLSQWAVIAAQAPLDSRRLLVAEGVENRLALLSLPDLTVLAGVTLGGAPQDAEGNRTLSSVYAVTRNGYFWRYETGTGRVDTLALRLNPRRMALDAQANKAWVVFHSDTLVLMVDLSGLGRVDSLFLSRIPTDVQFTADGGRAFVACRGQPGKLAVYDAASRSLLCSRDAGRGPFDVAVSMDGQFFAAGDSSDGQLYVWQVATDSLWQLSVGTREVRVRFSRRAMACYALGVAESRLLRIQLTSSGPSVQDTLVLPPSVREFVLWE